jgi:hypothetical protein
MSRSAAATPKRVIEFVSDKRFVRRARELKTIETMLRLYCRGHEHERSAPLCADCAALFEYATRRLERCVFGDSKPTCTNCLVHCYSAQAREQVRVVMRWAGPRMLLRHPIVASSTRRWRTCCRETKRRRAIGPMRAGTADNGMVYSIDNMHVRTTTQNICNVASGCGRCA